MHQLREGDVIPVKDERILKREGVALFLLTPEDRFLLLSHLRRDIIKHSHQKHEAPVSVQDEHYVLADDLLPLAQGMLTVPGGGVKEKEEESRRNAILREGAEEVGFSGSAIEIPVDEPAIFTFQVRNGYEILFKIFPFIAFLSPKEMGEILQFADQHNLDWVAGYPNQLLESEKVIRPFGVQALEWAVQNLTPNLLASLAKKIKV